MAHFSISAAVTALPLRTETAISDDSDVASGSVELSAAPHRTEEQQDSADAFSAFYREYLPSLVAFLMYQGASLRDASDLAQDAMVAAFQSWSKIEYPKAWTRRVAARALVRKIADTEEPREQIPEPIILLDDRSLSDWEENHDIVRLIRQLPPRQRQVLAWTLDGYKPAEIVVELSLSSESVRASLRKARRAITRNLAEADGITE